MRGLHGKAAIVTGGGSGIGRAICQRMGEEGCKLGVFDINLYGPIHTHFAVLPGMVERKAGCAVKVSSDAGRVSSSGEAVYSAAKGGIVAFGKTLSRELTRAGIRINTICPGPTDTPLFAKVATGDAGQKIVDGLQRAIPIRHLGQPDDYPGIIAFLASDDAA